MFSFPVTGGSKTWAASEKQTKTLQDAFPAVSVLAEYAKARAWLESNRERLKTPRGMPRFLYGWMERNQNGGRSNGAGSARAPGFAPARNEINFSDGIERFTKKEGA
jgi:hypothetical protein